MSTNTLNPSRAVRPLSNLLGLLKKRVAIWQIRQELAGHEYARGYSQHTPREAYELTTLKLRNDLAKLTADQNEAAAPKQHTSCKNPAYYPERMTKVFN